MAPQPTGSLAAAAAAAAPAVEASAPSQSDVMDAASTHSERTRQDLELKLQELIECLLELSITVYDFQSESNTLVHQKIQELIAQLSDIEGFKDKLDMMVPWEVLSYIEDGKNPDLFSKSFVEAVAGENQFTNGKITALKASFCIEGLVSFESALTQNLGLTFPDEMMDYDRILKDLEGTGKGGTVPTHNSSTKVAPEQATDSSNNISPESNHTAPSLHSSVPPS
ncbi:Mediator of RNA polymerase II transcription subunit 10 [Mortierella claussenii]|nr:Mediator of RNA polymerase II transcription subunit 10 [Mortierella claussenii]